jgi:uncharacterized protein
MELDTYSLVILRRGPRAAEYAGAELEELQAAHLAHLAQMKEEGHLLVAGPFDDQEDETFRGLCLYRGPLEEARARAEADPGVRAGRMRVEAMSWLTPKGALRFSA